VIGMSYTINCFSNHLQTHLTLFGTFDDPFEASHEDTNC